MRGILSLVFACAAFAQDAQLSFEVTSIRASGPATGPQVAGGTITGGPETSDPEQWRFARVPIWRILPMAFGVEIDQVQAPSWAVDQNVATSAKYDILAKVPAGASKEQASAMLRNLLVERLGLAFHHEVKDFTVYDLTVAKGGSKLKEAEQANGPALVPLQPGTPMRSIPRDADGFPQLPAGTPGQVGMGRDGNMYVSARMQTMQGFAVTLGLPLGTRHVTDKTGLTGKYDFKFVYSLAGLPGPLGAVRPAPAAGAASPIDNLADPAPDVFTALEKQLGLKLTKGKAPLDVIVIDHMEKTPTEN